VTQYHGKNLHFSIYDAGSVVRDLTAHVVSIDFPRSVDTADISTAGLGDHKFIAGLRGATITINLIWDDTATTGPDAVLEGLLGVAPNGLTGPGGFIFGPAGDEENKVRYTAAGHLTSYSPSSSVSDAVKATATLQVTGTVTRDLFPA
jgi:hypothetical protein